MVAQAALLDMKIAQVPVVLRPDGRSRPSHLRPWRDGVRHLFLLLRLAVTRPSRPARSAAPVVAD
jgi:hypothetical protein